ncbi:hypothetical protein CRG98_022018 [Punica granatum]|uniref:Uncharacterized protein n=1 Tax=Punica granatum TaxID=22663 RepID=A0A2I0JMP1_PUNGR|nr:hypothetical protein CRG98_022018 [Punica granatum]
MEWEKRQKPRWGPQPVNPGEGWSEEPRCSYLWTLARASNSELVTSGIRVSLGGSKP